MVKNNHKTEVFRFVAGVTIVFLFAVMLLPAVAEALETGCDDCTDHGDSVCGCVGCPPVIVAYEVPLPEYDQTLNVLKHFMTVRLVRLFPPGNSDDGRSIGEETVFPERKQRWNQFARCEIARRPED